MSDNETIIADGYSAKHHTGKPCINRGCGKPAGTAWTKLWCAECDKERKDGIRENLERMLARFKS